MIHVLESVLKILHFVTVFQWIKNANSEPKPQNFISKTNMVHLHSFFWRQCSIYNGYFRTKESSLKTSGFKKLFQSLNQCKITFIGYSVNMIYVHKLSFHKLKYDKKDKNFKTTWRLFSPFWFWSQWPLPMRYVTGVMILKITSTNIARLQKEITTDVVSVPK